MFGTLSTRLFRWRERVGTAPPVISRQLLLQSLSGRLTHITDDLPLQPPLFVLSTGRCGTKTLAALLRLTPAVNAFHEPLPDLYRLSRRVYHSSAPDMELLAEALRLARSNLWQATNLAGKRYVETASYGTFLMPAILRLIPRARFLHLTRAPDSFVLSAVRTGFYSGQSVVHTLISPLVGTLPAADWESRDPFAKCTWYWQEVNAFASDFIRSLPPDQGLHLRCEDVFRADPEALRQLYALVDSEPPSRRRIERVLGQQLNAGRYRPVAREVDSFTDEQREFLQQECGDLARELGYEDIDG